MESTSDLARREAALAWELRSAWAGGWQVVCTTRRRARLRGYVEQVAVTGAFALVWDGRVEHHVPVAALRSIRRPHFHERDGTRPAQRRRPPPIQLPPGQLALFDGFDGRPDGWADPRAEAEAGRLLRKQSGLRGSGD